MMPEAEASTTAQSDSADESSKLPPDRWILTEHVLIRQHNQFRASLFTPNEDADDPSPIPIKYLDIKLQPVSNVSFHVAQNIKSPLSIKPVY